jgi:hypothetical protein
VFDVLDYDSGFLGFLYANKAGHITSGFSRANVTVRNSDHTSGLGPYAVSTHNSTSLSIQFSQNSFKHHRYLLCARPTLLLVGAVIILVLLTRWDFHLLAVAFPP